MISPSVAAQMALYFYTNMQIVSANHAAWKGKGEPSANTLRKQDVLKAAPTENLPPPQRLR